MQQLIPNLLYDMFYIILKHLKTNSEKKWFPTSPIRRIAISDIKQSADVTDIHKCRQANNQIFLYLKTLFSLKAIILFLVQSYRCVQLYIYVPIYGSFWTFGACLMTLMCWNRKCHFFYSATRSLNKLLHQYLVNVLCILSVVYQSRVLTSIFPHFI